MSKHELFCRYGLICTLTLLLAGCGSTGKNSGTRFYLLNALPATTVPIAGAPTQPPLGVGLAPVNLPQYLERPQIVVRVAQNRLDLNEFDNWGGSLEKNMTRVLAANLSMLLGSPEIQIANVRQSDRYDAYVEIRVMRFERGPDARAVLHTQWRLYGPGRDPAPKITRISHFSSPPIPAPESGSGTEADVAAMSRLLGELSEVVAGAILQTGGS